MSIQYPLCDNCYNFVTDGTKFWFEKKKKSSENFQNATIQKLKKIATPIFRCFEENSRIFQDIVTDSTLHNLCGL